MEALTRTLISVCLCIQVTQTDGSSWTVNGLTSVKGLIGSCVVIPCSFDYPQPENKEVCSYTAIWNNDANQSIFHPVKEKIMEQYRDRTTLIGDIRNKNCSLKIDNFRSTDGGRFHFRIEMKNYKKYSYSNHKVSISTMNEPQPVALSMVEEMMEGQTVSPSCSVFYSCPTSPPVFHWSHSGDQRFHSQLLSDGQWKATSTLTFHPTHADHKKSLQCSVQMHNGKPLYTGSKVLQVKYAPVNVKVKYKSDVKEGQTVHLSCSSDANPRVSSYEWHNETAQVHKGSTYNLHNVSRHTKGPLYCTAVNELGRINSSLVRFNVLYAPEIKNASSCSSEGDMVKCVCMAESNPSSIIHFVLSNNVHLSTKVEHHGSLTVGTLQANIGSSTYVHCVANNTEGSANVTLSLPVKINMLYIYISAGAAGGLMILVGVVIVVIKCRRRSGDTAECNLSATKAEKELELSVPQYSMAQRSVRKATYDDVGCQSIYATDHIYGNMEDEADAIYANT
ncbi:sialic acid-binding Ig-like lectin 14 isoform X2 [Mugil cephalus]|uniref:sialic acid-binding Ig-like lectin 14 isoform X2 n=1 Tax=Mugil cephalus TaxID=48193 RepID=UPI001FB7C66C|nr:sialic acid-binding Ig-like lectin 14 isoform X2 [Mugil cephalus]